MAVDWQLTNCCGEEETIFLGLFAGFFFLNLALWNTPILKPFKLIAVFIHELSHATACWWTGGKVEAIEVYNNEGGVTKYRGGIRTIIIPAGYIGGAFYGGLFVTLSGNRVSATVAACLFVTGLVVSLRYSPNSVLVMLSITFAAVTALFIFLEWFVISPILQFVTLYYGVFIGSFSVYDIYDDLITRTAEGSDAVACSQLYPCCRPRCVGVQFGIVAIFFQGIGVWLALVWMSSDL